MSLAWPKFVESLEEAGHPVPKNSGRDLKARFGDRALINWYLAQLEAEGQYYDSVRGAFIEGEPIFEGSSIHLESHIQICIRNPSCVVGVFTPRS